VQGVVFVQAMNAGQEMQEQSQEATARSIAEDRSSVDKELMMPLLQPFLAGILSTLAKGGWKGDAAIGLLSQLLGACCGGKKATNS
jgi:hypothetical protein